MSFIHKIKEFFLLLFACLLIGLCVGILGGLTFMFVRTHPLIALGLTSFCLLLRLSTLKTSWREKNYLAFVSQIFMVSICICAPASLVWIGIITSYSDFSSDFIDKIVFIVLILFFASLISFVLLTLKYFGETQFGKKVDQILNGAEIITGLKNF